MCKQKKMYKNVETTEHNKKRRKKARSTNIFYKVICWLTDTLVVESADHYMQVGLSYFSFGNSFITHMNE